MGRFFARHSLIVLMVLTAAAPVLVVLSRGMEQDNAIEHWLPEKSRELQVFNALREHFGREEFVVAGWEGATLDDPGLMQLFARRLQKEASGVKKVITSQDFLDRMTGPPANLPAEEAQRRLEGFLLGPPDAKTGKRPAGMMIVLTEQATRDRKSAIAEIRRVAGSVYEPWRESSQYREELYLGGPPVVNAALDVWGKSTIDRILVYLGLVCIVLSFIALRSWRLAVLVLVTAGYSVLASKALVGASGGSMNLVMVVMAPLVLVLALSGAVHLAHYWREATRSGTSQSAIGRAWEMAWRPCTLASVTTAIGLVSLASSEINPVRQFGIYSAAGSLIALGLVLFALPAGLALVGGGRVKASSERAQGWDRLAGMLVRRRRVVTLLTLLLFAVAAAGLGRIKTEVKPIQYFPEHDVAGLPPSPVRAYRFLEENVACLVPIETVVRFEPGTGRGASELGFLDRLELVRAIEQRMRDLPEVRGSLSLADFMPEPPQSPLLRTAYELAAASVASSRSEAAAFRQIGEDGIERWRISARVPALAPLDYGDVVQRLHVPAQEVLHDRGLQAGVGVDITGLIPLSYKAQQEVLRGLMWSFAMAFVVIMVVIALWMRSLAGSMVTMLPNLTPVVLVFGAMAWSGTAIDVASMMTASVALGIAVDGTLHYLTWFRYAVRDGMSRSDAVVQAMRHCGPALVETALIAGLGLATLGFAPFGPTARFGWMMAALLGAALVGDLILLPALLAGRGGRLVEGAARFFRSQSTGPLAGPHHHAAAKRERKA